MVSRFFLELCKSQDDTEDTEITRDLFPRSFIPTRTVALTQSVCEDGIGEGDDRDNDFSVGIQEQRESREVMV